MKKSALGLLVLFLAFSFGAGVVRAASSTVTGNGTPVYYADTLAQKFDENEYAVKSEIKAAGNKVVVDGWIYGVKEAKYFSELSGEFVESVSKVPAVTLSTDFAESPFHRFTAYLFDDSIDPAVLEMNGSALVLCEDIERNPVGGGGIQGKCKVISCWGTDEVRDYHNKELKDWLETPVEKTEKAAESAPAGAGK